MYYLIKETLTPCDRGDIINRKDGDPQYVLVMNLDTWKANKDRFNMIIDIPLDPSDVLETKATVNMTTLTGTFYVPRRKLRDKPPHRSAFALTERGIIFIENGEFAGSLVRKISETRKWKYPSLERFLYDFMELLIDRDLRFFVEAEQELRELEEEILAQTLDEYPQRLSEIRSFLMELRIHYEQLQDFGHELEENENGFFKEKNLRYFRLFTDRIDRLLDHVRTLWDYTVQLQELFSTQTDIKMNRIMTVLTVITAIFMPLTLIVGWYGMNFVFMPELQWRYGYLGVIILCIVIVVVGILWFRKRKWL